MKKGMNTIGKVYPFEANIKLPGASRGDILADFVPRERRGDLQL